jgi:preprotein translocase subunit SecG
MTGRGTANLLTRTTAVLATLFMVLALAMALLGRGQAQRGSILDLPPGPAIPAAPATPGAAAPGSVAPGAPAAPAPAVPAAPAQPSVPTN